MLSFTARNNLLGFAWPCSIIYSTLYARPVFHISPSNHLIQFNNPLNWGECGDLVTHEICISRYGMFHCLQNVSSWVYMADTPSISFKSVKYKYDWLVVCTWSTLVIKYGIMYNSDHFTWKREPLINHIRGLWCQTQVYRAGISKCTPQDTVGCNYLSLPGIPASATEVHIHTLQYSGESLIETNCLLAVLAY